MADRTSISWTDATWNPLAGCSRVSEGCRNCYAEAMATRFNKPGMWGEGLATMVRTPDGKSAPRWTGKVRFNEAALDQPLRWRKPRRIFVNSTSDLFHESVPDEWIDRVFAVMALSPQHTFQVLTKRPERMWDYMDGIHRACWPVRLAAVAQGMRPTDLRPNSRGELLMREYGPWPLPNVWLGVSVEDQVTADVRIPYLVSTPAAVRFASVEPLLGPLDLNPWLFIVTHDDEAILAAAAEGEVPALEWREPATIRPEEISQPRLDWVIVGGESGPRARPMHPDWVRKIRDQCADAAVPFHFKQWGEWVPIYDRDRDDPDWRLTPSTEGPRRRILNLAGGHGFHGERVHVVERVGTANSGRYIDCVEHLAFPQVTP